MYRKNLKDEFYTRKAKEEGYPARSVYKLKEIDEKYKIIKRGDAVLDLGCSPGSWLLYISEKVGKNGKIVGIDIEDIKIPPKNNILFIKKDILSFQEEELKEWQGRFGVVVADLSPRTSGIKSIDVAKSLELNEAAFEVVKTALKKGGNFVCKIFEGEGADEFIRKVQKHFEIVKRFRPMAVMKRSKEFYIIAKGFKIY